MTNRNLDVVDWKSILVVNLEREYIVPEYMFFREIIGFFSCMFSKRLQHVISFLLLKETIVKNHS